MMKEHSMFYIGMADFSEPTLLLIGDEFSLRWFADQINAGCEIQFGELPNFVRQSKIDLRLIPSASSGRLTRQGNAFNWEITEAEALQFAQQLRELADSASPAHAYLDPEINISDIQVVASKGEYNPQAVFGL